MRSPRTVLIVVCVLMTTTGAFALEWTRGRSTEYARLAEDGSGVQAAFSPDGRSLAIVCYDDSDSEPFVPRTDHKLLLRVWSQDSLCHRLVLPSAPSERPAYGPTLTEVHWLPDGRFLCLVNAKAPGQHCRLVRVRDGAWTTAGCSGDWFVVNDDWGLTDREAGSLHDLLVGAEHDSLTGPPPGVPSESENWWYEDFVRSPADRHIARYTGWRKDTGYCCCEKDMMPRYLGIIDLASGKMRRLTWGSDHTIWQPTWSPAGAALAHLRCPYGRDEQGRTILSGSDLHIIRSDGTGDRHLIADVYDYEWLQDGRLAASVADDLFESEDIGPQQIALVDPESGEVEWLTSGPFVHTLIAENGDVFLVSARPVQDDDPGWGLYLIRPL